MVMGWVDMKRKSQQREAILGVIKNSTGHPSAEWIYQQVRCKLPDIGLATVYRNLKMLKESGHVLELPGIKGAARFDGNISPHCHFFCDNCGKILDLNELPDILHDYHITPPSGALLTRYSLELGGLCPDCHELNPDSVTKR